MKSFTRTELIVVTDTEIYKIAEIKDQQGRLVRYERVSYMRSKFWANSKRGVLVDVLQ